MRPCKIAWACFYEEFRAFGVMSGASLDGLDIVCMDGQLMSKKRWH